jgi:flagellar basal-body rod protein FlgG
MRPYVFLLAVLPVACAVPPGAGSGQTAAGPRATARDAAFGRDGAAVSLSDAVVAVDPATADLLGAILATSEQMRRIHLLNIANIGTPGWKRWDAEFGSRVIHSDGVALAVPVLLGQRPTMTAGALHRTDRWLDLAIDGDGMFAVELPGRQVGYTRCGALQVAADGRLWTNDRPLLPAIVVPDSVRDVEIDAEGAVTGRRASGGAGILTLGRLELHRFAVAEQLGVGGPGLWIATPRSGVAVAGRPGDDGFGALRQGFLEGSNVELDRELLALQAIEHRRERVLTVVRALGFVAP